MEQLNEAACIIGWGVIYLLAALYVIVVPLSIGAMLNSAVDSLVMWQRRRLHARDLTHGR